MPKFSCLFFLSVEFSLLLSNLSRYILMTWHFGEFTSECTYWAPLSRNGASVHFLDTEQHSLSKFGFFSTFLMSIN